MKKLLRIGGLLMLMLTGCSADINDYRASTPKLDIFDYFNGKTEAWGMVQDFSQKQVRRFHVEIVGSVIANTLTLHENFVYDDGEKQQRTWQIHRLENGHYEGTANDIEGVATGQAVGNTFNWQYKMNVTSGGKTWLLSFDDWMYLQDNHHLFNLTKLKKFGITVGTVTLFFDKPAEQ